MIKFAIRSGKIPIFVTEKPNLYSDMIRDLDDIGMTRELALDTAKPSPPPLLRRASRLASLDRALSRSDVGVRPQR
jgi:hypothetical protein